MVLVALRCAVLDASHLAVITVFLIVTFLRWALGLLATHQQNEKMRRPVFSKI